MKARMFFLSLVLVSSTVLAAPGHSGDHDDQAIGKPGVASAVTRTVNVDMTDDMRFNPANVNVKQGETVRFVVKNSGSVKHEFVLGSDADLKQHYKEMMKHPEMEHSDPNMVSLAGGQTGEVIWQFTKAGKVNFACLQPGHYDVGMKGSIGVEKKCSCCEGECECCGKQCGKKQCERKDKAESSSTITRGAMSGGEVKKIDKSANKITLKHGEIKNLDMPPMTMVFKVSDPAMLEHLKQGDKVKFTAEKKDGAMTITMIQVIS